MRRRVTNANHVSGPVDRPPQVLLDASRFSRCYLFLSRYYFYQNVRKMNLYLKPETCHMWLPRDRVLPDHCSSSPWRHVECLGFGGSIR